MKDVTLFTLGSDVNIGLYAKRVGDVLFCGGEPTRNERETIERVLKLKIARLSIAGTPFPGVFMLDAGDRIIVPHIIYDSEKTTIAEAGFDIEVWNTHDTALANSVCIDGDKAIISKATHPSLAQTVREAGFEVLELATGAFEAPGALIMPAHDKVLVGGGLDADVVSGFLGKTVVEASVNRGSPFLASGIISSEAGVLIGRESLPAEVMTITEVL